MDLSFLKECSTQSISLCLLILGIASGSIGSIILGFALNKVISLLVTSSNRVDNLIRTNGRLQIFGLDKSLNPEFDKSTRWTKCGIRLLWFGLMASIIGTILS